MSQIAIVGPGAVGLTYAAELRPRHHVILCGRRVVGRVDVERPPAQMRRETFDAYTDPERLSSQLVDWVLVTLKAHQVAGAARWLSVLHRPHTAFAVLQNGVEQHESVEPFLPGVDILPAIVWSGSELVTPDHLVVNGDLRIVVPDGDIGQAFAELFLHSAVRVDRTRDFSTEAWRKLLTNAVAGLEVLSLRRAEMFRLDDVCTLAHDYASECVLVGRAAGADLTDEDARRTSELFSALAPEVGTSMLYDRQANRPLEWHVRNGVIQRLGRQLGVPTPISDVLIPLLRAASSDSYT